MPLYEEEKKKPRSEVKVYSLEFLEAQQEVCLPLRDSKCHNEVVKRSTLTLLTSAACMQTAILRHLLKSLLNCPSNTANKVMRARVYKERERF